MNKSPLVFLCCSLEEKNSYVYTVKGVVACYQLVLVLHTAYRLTLMTTQCPFLLLFLLQIGNIFPQKKYKTRKK